MSSFGIKNLNCYVFVIHRQRSDAEDSPASVYETDEEESDTVRETNIAPFSTSCLGLSLLLIPWSDSSLPRGRDVEPKHEVATFIFPFYFLSSRSCFVHVDSLRSGNSSRSIRAWRFGYWKLRENKN